MHLMGQVHEAEEMFCGHLLQVLRDKGEIMAKVCAARYTSADSVRKFRGFFGRCDITIEVEMSSRRNQFSLTRNALHWFEDSVRYRGTIATGRLFCRRLWEFVRDLSPSRRELRFGDLQFDFDHRVDTTWSNVSLRTKLRELFSGEPYQPIEAEQFHEMMNSLAIDYARFTFIDLGSGKGRALLLASNYEFRRIIGVEILPELSDIAQKNIGNYRSDSQRCFQLETLCADARRFELPQEPTLLYLFNPFFEPVLQEVLERIEESLRAHPREFILLYVNPLSEHIVASRPFLKKVGGTHQYSIFLPVS